MVEVEGGGRKSGGHCCSLRGLFGAMLGSCFWIVGNGTEYLEETVFHASVRSKVFYPYGGTGARID